MNSRGVIRMTAFLILISVNSISQAFATPVMIKLLIQDREDYNKIGNLNIPVYHRQESFLIAEFEDLNLKALDDAGLRYEIIDRRPWTTSYYVVSRSQPGVDTDLSLFGEVLVQEEDFHLLKISDEMANSLAGKGYHIAKVFRQNLPLKSKQTIEPKLKPYSYDPGIDSLLSLVSQDSLFTWNLRLQNFKTRYSYSDSIYRASQWLFDKLASFDIDSVYFHHFTEDLIDQYNVVAVIPGTVCQDKVIVVGGHYDSVVYGTGTNPYTWAPGADDNGSGTVATLEIARIVAENPLPVTVIFVPFAMEEQGLIGSYHFAEYLYNDSIDVRLMLNADMIGHSVDEVNDVWILASSRAMEFVNIMIDMASTYTSLTAGYSGQSSGSDHYSFYQWGYHALFAQEGEFFTYGWHKNYDVIDSLDFSYMKEVVKMELATLITVAYSLEPDYLPGDANADGDVTVADVIYLINYFFKSGPYPEPYGAGDCNNDGSITVSDIVYLINHLFKGGPSPRC
ncbi:MAG: M20/M25/M40 family metallo-hydrolase [candidate division Zixibacteria bacterium]|nr:M20/M25/M40 family metallo-hydrolase [candidate division Zixibacteria bacterium]